MINSNANLGFVSIDGKTLRHWAEAGSARITVNVQESRLIFDASQVSIEKLERKLPNVLGKKIVETVDLAGLSRFNSFNSAYISLISQLTQTFIHPPIDNSVS